MLIDSHCHLAGTEFVADLDAVVDRARSSGVTGALVILAADESEEVERAASVQAAWPEVRFATGVHPHAAGKFEENPAEAARLVLAAIAATGGVRAVGEIGLDYHYDFAPRAAQQAVFAEQLRVARRLGLPFVLHTRTPARQRRRRDGVSCARRFPRERDGRLDDERRPCCRPRCGQLAHHGRADPDRLLRADGPLPPP